MVKIMLMILLLTFILIVISKIMKTEIKQTEKKSIFECGFDPSHEKRNSFSLRFFMLTIIFLLFDLEITFIMPLPLNMKNSLLSMILLNHIFIIFFFLLSTYLEWKQGALNWFWFGI